MSTLDPEAALSIGPSSTAIRPRKTRWRTVPWHWRYLDGGGGPTNLWASYWLKLLHPRRTGWLGTVYNSSGMNTASVHRCSTCKRMFYVVPAAANFGDCVGDECGSYDPHRDVSFLSREDK